MRLLLCMAPAAIMAGRLDDKTLLRRAKAIDDWFAAPTNRTTPVAWTVRRKSDVQLGEMISSRAKKAYRGSMRGAPRGADVGFGVVVPARRAVVHGDAARRGVGAGEAQEHHRATRLSARHSSCVHRPT